MPLTRLTPLDGESILSLADCKAHLRVLHNEEDAVITSLRDAAIAQVERLSGVILATADFRWTAPRFASAVCLPVRPITEIGDVAHLDDAGASVTYAGARIVSGKVYPAVGGSFPAANGQASVEFTAGVESPDEVPGLIAAVKLLLGHWFANREATGDEKELPFGVQYLIDSHRQVLV